MSASEWEHDADAVDGLSCAEQYVSFLRSRRQEYLRRTLPRRLSTMPAIGTHSRRPLGSARGLHFCGSALKVLSTQSAMLSESGSNMAKDEVLMKGSTRVKLRKTPRQKTFLSSHIDTRRN